MAVTLDHLAQQLKALDDQCFGNKNPNASQGVIETVENLSLFINHDDLHDELIAEFIPTEYQNVFAEEVALYLRQLPSEQQQAGKNLMNQLQTLFKQHSENFSDELDALRNRNSFSPT